MRRAEARVFDGKLVESDCVCHNHVSQAMAPLHFADAADSVNVIYDRPRKWMNSMGNFPIPADQ